jgi:hypothetical protein
MGETGKRTSAAMGTAPVELFQRALGLLPLIGVMCLGGCSSTGMKGTPFYSGEYSKRQGPVEQRVNVWPAFYYREPAVSILWPMFELTDDHAAVRPLWSVYGLDRTNHGYQYNVLWPLAQFDLQTGDSHVFPLFWGDDCFVLFPLYWHGGQPFDLGKGYDSLFPLWIFNRGESNRFSLYTPWPLVHVWSDPRKHADGSMVLPLYWQRTDPHSSKFLSPLWLSEQQSDGDYWRLLLPLAFQMKSGDASAFASVLWSQGHSERGDWQAMFPLWYYGGGTGGRFDLSCPFPLARWWNDPIADESGSMLLPLYAHFREARISKFFSLPWSGGSGDDGWWRLQLPLFYQASNAWSSTFASPLWAQGRVGESKWDVLPPLWFRNWEGTNAFSFYGPLTHVWADAKASESGSTVIPLFWQRSQRERSQFFSALWLSDTDRSGNGWRLLPPLFYQQSDATGYELITPLWSQGCSESSDWATIVPLCYWDRRQHRLLSPLWAHWREQQGETWIAPWTLSWATRLPQRTDLTLLAGWAHASWGGQPGLNYMLPLFYQDAGRGMFLSPLWMRWREGDEAETSIFPPALSWLDQSPERTDLWLMGGFARASWGARPGADYLLPLFYRDDRQLFTPLFGGDRAAGYFFFATPLAGVRYGARSGSWVFPLYSHSREARTDRVNDHFLLLGRHTRDRKQSRSMLIPFYYYENRLGPESGGEITQRSGTYGTTFFCLPACWYRDRCYFRTPKHAPSRQESTAVAGATNTARVSDLTRSHGMFPLWDYSAQCTPAECRSNLDASILLWLYDYKHEAGPLPGNEAGGIRDYTRSRVLWRLWHYERNNGDSSLDVFPAFTYDRKVDGFKKVSFLWRFFRYEQEPGGGRQLDVLFVPLVRTKTN